MPDGSRIRYARAAGDAHVVQLVYGNRRTSIACERLEQVRVGKQLHARGTSQLLSSHLHSVCGTASSDIRHGVDSDGVQYEAKKHSESMRIRAHIACSQHHVTSASSERVRLKHVCRPRCYFLYKSQKYLIDFLNSPAPVSPFPSGNATRRRPSPTILKCGSRQVYLSFTVYPVNVLPVFALHLASAPIPSLPAAV